MWISLTKLGTVNTSILRNNISYKIIALSILWHVSIIPRVKTLAYPMDLLGPPAIKLYFAT